MFTALVQYYATTYWGIIITFNLLFVLFITVWVHINTMAKRHEEVLKQVKLLHKRLDETNELIDDLFDENEKPNQQGFMPVYPVQQSFPQQFQPPYQP